MTLPDPEALRQEYNDHYRSSIDHWSCHDPAQAASIVALVLQRLSVFGGAPARGGSVLDVGCAKGHICEAFRQAGLEAHGLDYSDVAVEKATKLFPACRFYHMDGLNPEFDRKFDLVFMRGFSGCNTLEIGNVAALCNRYVALLKPGGFLVLGYSTDFSGRHRPGDTVCWSQRQIDQITAQVRARWLGSIVIPRRTLFRALKIGLGRFLGRHSKHYLYLFFRSAGGDPAASAPT